MDEKIKEVKEEFIKNEDGDEIVNPELLDDKEKDTPSDSSPEDKPDQEVEEKPVETEEESTEEPETSEVDESVPAPVEGETIIERARRLEIEHLRQINRDLKKKSLLGGEEEEPEVGRPVAQPSQISEKEDITSKYDKDQLDNFRELFQSEANRLGYVKKEEFEKSSFESGAEDTLDEFLLEHKEYLPENDPKNALWDKFREEYSLYKRPNSPKKFKVLLERIHNDVTLGGGRILNSAEVAAKQAKIKQASHGGTTVAKKNKPDSGLDPTLRNHMKGFTKEELDEMGL